MAGNVWEWTSTKYCPSCSSYINRGGGWNRSWGASTAKFGATFPGRDEPQRRGSYLGFRCASGPNATPLQYVSSAPPIEVPVKIYKITMDDGSGNPLWTDSYIKRVFEASNQMLHGDIQFIALPSTTIKNSLVFKSDSQSEILNTYWSQFSRQGQITVFVSSPNARDSAGLAKIFSGAKDFKPVLVMRSRANTGSDNDVYEVAAIFLHEISHTLGFTHDGSMEKMPYYTDGWWELPPARDVMINFAEKVSFNSQVRKP